MRILIAGFVWLVASASCAMAQQSDSIDGLLFYASFDEQANADFSAGKGTILTSPNLRREEIQEGIQSDAVRRLDSGGRVGGALQFDRKVDEVVYFQGGANLPYSDDGFEGTYSFWLKLTPNEDLAEGYVDPIQITDKAWNNASFFVDFTQSAPRDFRLGVFSNYEFWNPDDLQWDNVPDEDRPLVTVSKLPFSSDKWTHVAFTFSSFNSSDQAGQATLYLDGVEQGKIEGEQQITWSPDDVVIMIGIYYIGGFDELAIFDRALDADEIQQMYDSPELLKEQR